MATINVNQAFVNKNNILRTTLHQGENLKLKLYSKDNSGGREFILELTTGWNHTQRKHPEKGTIEEIVKIAEVSGVTDAVILKSAGCEILADDNSFTRYNFTSKSPKNPITHEWILTASPNKADTSTITPIS
jgi:hypothetical protein